MTLDIFGKVKVMTRRLTPEEQYEYLARKPLSYEQLGRWLSLQQVLDVHSDDTIWTVLVSFEFYYDLFESTGQRLETKVVFWARIITSLFALNAALTGLNLIQSLLH